MKTLLNKIKELLLSRFVWLCIVILLQISLFAGMAFFFSRWVSILFEGLSIVMSVWIVGNKMTDTHKLAWIVPILLFPVVGGVLYLVFGMQRVSKRKNIQFLELQNETQVCYKDNSDCEMLNLECKTAVHRTIRFLERRGFPAYCDTKAVYFSEANTAFKAMLKDLSAAKRYIFLEFFIVDLGYMWEKILEILKQKARGGVEVRIIYDDVGCVDRVPLGYFKQLKKMGIKCHIFNRVSFFLNSYLTNRDHRKLMIVDGEVAFVCGFNLADEYINKRSIFGHWKDSGVRLEGSASRSLTAMFLHMWNLEKKSDIGFDTYLKEFNREDGLDQTLGLTQPFCCGPILSQRIYEYVYISLIYSAQCEVCLFTPYFVPTGEFIDACKIAAQSGVRVKLVYPKIYDKWYINLLSRSYFRQMIQKNVEIYEYLPGFIHSKSILVDREIGVVGSANVDYRSFYSQFEAGVLMFKTEGVLQLANDCEETLKECHRVTMEECIDTKRGTKILAFLFRLFRPLF